MQNIGKLDSPHAIRIYEMMMQFYSHENKKGWLKISPDELITIFELPPSYAKNKSSIKQKIIDPSIKKINSNSNIRSEVEVRKVGRSIVQYSFKFEEK
jgi:plasmid replication initiation protein